MLLQHAQQLRLQLERHFADFVEEHDAAFRRAEHTEAATGSAGERALLVAEQLAFGQRRSERRAVDGNKRFVAARTQAVQQPSPEFFAGAGFAAHQNGAFDIGRALHMARNAIHFGIRAQDPALRIFRSQLE